MTAAPTLHVVALATLFPDASRPNLAIFVERSLAALARQPHVTVTVVAPIGLPPWPLSLHPRYTSLRALPEQEEWRGLTVYRPRFRLIPRYARPNAAAVARAAAPIVARLAAAGRADVLQAQFFWPDAPAAQQISRLLDLPYSVKARGGDISYWAQRRDIAPAILAAADGADAILSVARSLRDDMVALGMDGDKIAVHYTGLDAGRFHVQDQAQARSTWHLPPDVPIMLSVGALTERKGQALVIAAMRDLPPDTIYVMAGTGDATASLRALAEHHGVADRVRQLGIVANDRLPSLYAAADLMVLPSASEGLANAWVEALACGTPLVLCDIAPAHELIDAPDAGRIAAREPSAIATAVRAVLANPPDRAALSARTQARFDWDRHGAELAAHLQGVCVSKCLMGGSGGGT